MPRRFWSMSDLLRGERENRDQDKRVTEAVRHALSKREVAQRLYENATFWKEWR